MNNTALPRSIGPQTAPRAQDPTLGIGEERGRVQRFTNASELAPIG